MYPFRFLFLLYAMPPMSGTAPKRNFRISSFIKAQVGYSTLFTAAETGTYKHNDHGSTVTIPAADYRKVLQRTTADGALPERRKTSVIMQFFIRLINSFPINIIAGEGGLIYFITLLRKGAKSIRQEGITHLYSSYRPFADHYVAYLLKKKHPQLYWIADFRDLIIDPHYNHILFPKAHQSFFNKMFSRADLLTTVSDGLAAQLKSHHSNVITLRNGIGTNWQLPEAKASKKFTITYTGSMFLDKRNPEPLFQALRDLFQETKFDARDIQLLYAGKDGSVWQQIAKRYRFESLFVDKGILSDEATRTLQQEACVNILLTISSSKLQGVLTGKMVEYFEAGVPVLGIVMEQNDPELQKLLQSLEAGDSFSDQEEDLEGIKDFLLKEYQYWKAHGTNRIAINGEQLLSTLSMDAVMQPLFQKLTLS